MRSLAHHPGDDHAGETRWRWLYLVQQERKGYSCADGSAELAGPFAFRAARIDPRVWKVRCYGKVLLLRRGTS